MNSNSPCVFQWINTGKQNGGSVEPPIPYTFIIPYIVVVSSVTTSHSLKAVLSPSLGFFGTFGPFG